MAKRVNRIEALFKKRKRDILSVFYTAGYPGLQDTVKIAAYLQASGADIIEIGIPFSDPIADGEVIQQSSKRAIENGMTLNVLLQQVKELRKTVTLPIVLMGYLNPVLQYGMEKFCNDAAKAGVDGLILPDMPHIEYTRSYKSLFDANDLRTIFLVTPTTSDERIRQIDAQSNAFIYAVSASATTGARNSFSSAQQAYFIRLKNLQIQNPVLIGFGISNHETFNTACQYANGAIIGSAFIKAIGDTDSLQDTIYQFVQSIRNN